MYTLIYTYIEIQKRYYKSINLYKIRLPSNQILKGVNDIKKYAFLNSGHTV